MSRSRAAQPVVAAAVLVVLTGCMSSPAPVTGSSSASGSPSASGSAAAGPYQPTDEDLATIEAALLTRAQAVRKKDRKAFLSVVDPRDKRLLARERTLYANLTSLPLTSYAVKVKGTYLPPRGVGPKAVALRPVAVEQLQVAGVDRRPAGYPVEISWVRRGERWLIADERSPEEGVRNQASESRPWFGDPISVRQSGDTVVLVDRADDARADALLSRVRSGIDRDASVLGIAGRYDVLVDATSNGLATKMNTVDDEEAAAVSFRAFSRDISGRVRGVAGSRIKINPRQIAAIVDDDRVLRHELVHFLTAGDGVAPKWVSEGLAEYVAKSPYGPSEYYYPAAAYRTIRRAAGDGPPGSGSFGLHSLEDYTLSWCAVTYLVRAQGMATFQKFRDDFTGSGDAYGDSEVPRLLRRHYDLTPRQFRRGTATLVRQIRSQ